MKNTSYKVTFTGVILGIDINRKIKTPQFSIVFTVEDKEIAEATIVAQLTNDSVSIMLRGKNSTSQPIKLDIKDWYTNFKESDTDSVKKFIDEVILPNL